MAEPKTNRLRNKATGLVLLYAALVVGWAIGHRVIGDGFWLLALVNAFAVYLFAPLPLMALLALIVRRRLAWFALLAVTLLLLRLFGGELTPPPPVVHAETDGPALTVMTYNVLYVNGDATPMATAITSADPDLIAFQELTPLLAGQLERHIGAQYPYRTPLHADCRAEVAIWSRYPIQAEDVDSVVLCRVRPVLVDLGEHTVRVVDVHGWPYTMIDRESVEQSFHWRKEQMDLVLHTIEGKPEPVILLGDLNSAPMHEVYQTLSAHLTDAFREAGWGLGHTFPATTGRVLGLPRPGRLVRIDYVFHSDEWRAEAAQVQEWDGASDHLPVIARLRLSGTD
jgi:vancomycin resistance protein VanJ